MKNLTLILVIAIILFGCGTKQSKQTATEETQVEALVLSVDELYENPDQILDKEIVVKGTVMHVCKQGGGRCFLMGSNEDITIRVEAGEKIGAFDQEQMGSELEIVGIFKEVKTEADAHNPGKEHGEHAEGEEEHAEDAETENAHRIIAESQEAAEVVYFIDGIKVKKQ